MFPFIIYKIKDSIRIVLILFFILSLLLVTFFFPLWVNAPTPGGISGYTFHIISIINNYSSPAGFAAKVILVFFGISSFYVFYNMIMEIKVDCCF